MAEWQLVEYLGEQVEHLLRVFGFDFAFEAIHLIHVDALVIASGHEEVIRVE